MKAKQANSISIPDFDPIHGRNGPLSTIWKGVAAGIAT